MSSIFSADVEEAPSLVTFPPNYVENSARSMLPDLFFFFFCRCLNLEASSQSAIETVGYLNPSQLFRGRFYFETHARADKHLAVKL